MTHSEFVTLRGGLVASVAALRVLWTLEDKGCDVRLGADGALLVGPRDRLTEDERAFIRAHKSELVRLVQYDAASVDAVA